MAGPDGAGDPLDAGHSRDRRFRLRRAARVEPAVSTNGGMCDEGPHEETAAGGLAKDAPSTITLPAGAHVLPLWSACRRCGMDSARVVVRQLGEDQSMVASEGVATVRDVDQ